MQHPDEGMIHSWLDGALSAEEAAQVESHVASCETCATSVAEARGFIAASSRILTALDDVPRGVLPAAPARKRDLRVFWRAAAAVLVVAGGSLVVMREGGPDTSLTSTTAKEATTLSARTATTAPPSQDMAAARVPTATAPTDGKAVSQPPATVQAKPLPAPQIIRGRVATGSVEQDLSKQSAMRRPEAPVGAVVGETGMADAVTSGRGATQQMQANVAVPEVEAPLRVVKVERTLGSRRTTYEIAPTQTVTLTEPEPVQTSAIGMAAGSAVRRQATTGNSARAVQPMAAEAASAPPPPMDSRAGADSTKREEASAAKTSAAPAAARFAAPSNTINWIDAQTGKTLTLSGNVSEARLQEIRKRIERERAGANTRTP